MTVLSINVAQAEQLQVGRSSVNTGILKRPVPQVKIGRNGLERDFIANKKYHGGPDQAVYIYTAEDYAWWEEQLGQKLEFGTFGENLTFPTFGSEPPRVGDRWQVGEVTLELTAPRIPCSKLAARMGDPKFLKRFVQANRGGAYARVLQAGTVKNGDPLQLTKAATENVTIPQLFEMWHSPERPADLLEKALKAPLAERTRAALENWS